MFLYAPSSQYGRPDDLKQLVEACHARGLAVFLDVVYNHFGPEGNYLPAIAPDFFTDRHQTPWGAAIDFSGPQSRPVRDFFIDNALYWLEEFHFDGLRFDAVHAIFDESEPDIISEIGQTSGAAFPVAKFISSLRTTTIRPAIAPRGGSRRRLTTPNGTTICIICCMCSLPATPPGYYADYAVEPAKQLGRALAEGLAYQGEPSPFRGGKPRGEPSGELPATAFVGFLQNHDQVGNHPSGRGSRRAQKKPHCTRQSRSFCCRRKSRCCSWARNGRASGHSHSSAISSRALRDAVREGRRREFAHFPEFQDEAARGESPIRPALSTFELSRLDWSEPGKSRIPAGLARYRHFFQVRAREIVPRLPGMPPYAGSYQVLGPKAVRVEWRLGDGSRLGLLANFGDSPAFGNLPEGRMVYSSAEQPGAPLSAAFFLAEPKQSEPIPMTPLRKCRRRCEVHLALPRRSRLSGNPG